MFQRLDKNLVGRGWGGRYTQTRKSRSSFVRKSSCETEMNRVHKNKKKKLHDNFAESEISNTRLLSSGVNLDLHFIWQWPCVSIRVSTM